MKTTLIPLTLILACACTGEHTTKAAPPKNTPSKDMPTTTQPEAPRVTPAPAPRVDPPVVQPPAADLDSALEERIRQVVASDAELANAAGLVTVTAKSGAVTLSGTVPSQDAKDALLSKVKALPGVVTCDDKLEVKM